MPVGPVALGVERMKPLPAHDRMRRAGLAGKQAQHELAAQGIAAAVVAVEPQVPDEREHVVGEDVGRLEGGIVRSLAIPVPARVGQDDPGSHSRQAQGPGPDRTAGHRCPSVRATRRRAARHRPPARPVQGHPGNGTGAPANPA